MPQTQRTYQLTPALVAAHSGGPVVCLDSRAIGQTYRLYEERPGPELNTRLDQRDDIVGAAPLFFESGATVEETGNGLTRVDIYGPIEQRSAASDMCGMFVDGHDAIADRMCAAFEAGDVLLVIDSPGGAHAGLQEGVARVLKAKAATGRRVTVFVDECCGSAAFWWAACVGDSICVPESGQVGSIGARSAHASIAGALAMEGVDPTYFVWPGVGKIAFATEFPLSDIGKERGERDTVACGEAFAAAVCAARPQLTRDAIVVLDADMLTGWAAVAAGLADEVASLEDVEAAALAAATGSVGSSDAMSGFAGEEARV